MALRSVIQIRIADFAGIHNNRPNGQINSTKGWRASAGPFFVG